MTSEEERYAKIRELPPADREAWAIETLRLALDGLRLGMVHAVISLLEEALEVTSGFSNARTKP